MRCRSIRFRYSLVHSPENSARALDPLHDVLTKGAPAVSDDGGSKGRLRRRAEIHHEVLLERNDPVEAPSQELVAGAEGIRDQHHAHQLFAEGVQILGQPGPVAAGEQRVAPHRVPVGCTRDRPLEQPATAPATGAGGPELLQRRRICRVGVADRLRDRRPKRSHRRVRASCHRLRGPRRAERPGPRCVPWSNRARAAPPLSTCRTSYPEGPGESRTSKTSTSLSRWTSSVSRSTTRSSTR